MDLHSRKTVLAELVIVVLILSMTAQPTLNAPDSSDAPGPRSLSERLFKYASKLNRDLHTRAAEERSDADYLSAMDAYSQVIRLHADNRFSAESLLRTSELQREMADAKGDSALYQQAIETFKQIVRNHPHSTFVGDALVNIAEIYEDNLQDLDGAANAYRELITQFPSSIMAREASAVLARFDVQLRSRPVDVAVPSGNSDQSDGRFGPSVIPQLTNLRNFSAPQYARVVLDLSGAVEYSTRREGLRNLKITLSSTAIASSLYGRRFIIEDSSLLQRIRVTNGGSGEPGLASGPGNEVNLEIEVRSPSDHSVIRLSEPERIVIDFHAAGSMPRRHQVESSHVSRPADDEAAPHLKSDSVATGRSARKHTNAWERQAPILSLPEINDPILPLGSETTAGSPTAGELKGEAPIKCIVIDPGHGGHDNGTISPSGMREKELVLDVARRLRNYIKRYYPEIEVILTRDSDRYIALEQRTAIANATQADLFISIHANASSSRVASGVETFFLSPDRAKETDSKPVENEPSAEAAPRSVEDAESAKDEKRSPVFASVTVGNRVAESREFARYVQSGLVRGIGAASPRTALNRGVKHAPFAVLAGAAMPSVLAEVSFMSNPRDESLLRTSNFRDRIAASLFAGLNAYLKRAPRTPQPNK